MAKRGIITVLIILLISTTAYAQISRDITKIRCGDGVLDEYEMCEKGIESDKCEKMAELLGIDADCFERECVCVPFVLKTFCGNDIREGIEMCDGTSDDFCPQFGEIIGVDLVCNPDTCLCDIATGVPDTYDPTKNETEEEPEGMAVCGDGELQRQEECDPPNTLCDLPDGHVGVCAEGCKCVETESIGIGDEDPEETEDIEEEPEDVEEEPETEQEEKEEQKEMTEIAKQGFFARFWGWFKDLFS